MRTDPVLLVTHRYPGVVCDDSLVKSQDRLVARLEPAHLVLPQVIDKTLQDRLTSDIDGHVLDGTRKHRVTGGHLTFATVLHST